MTHDRLLAEDLHFRRGDRMVLRGASLLLQPGEVVSLLGANGAGKTTLLHLLLGFDSPRSGQVLLDGIPLSSLGRRRIARSIAYVPQAHAAPFPYTVREVVTLGRLPLTGLFRAPSAGDRQAVDEVLERMRLSHLAGRPYTHLSGGERQLTLIARALAQEAGLLVMDEPLNGLDYGNQIRLLERLQDLAGQGWGILLTTHHPDHAANWSSRVAVLDQGRITRTGPPGEVVTPETIHALYGVRVRAERTIFRPQAHRR